jgi:excinuclease ABC subunit C
MADAAGRWEFEHAAALRDRARRLEALRDQFLQLREALDTLSFLYRVDGAEAGGRIYLIRRGTVRAVFAPPETAAARRDLRQAVDRCFAAPETPTAVVGRHQVAEILLIARWFRRNPDELERTAPPERAGRLMKQPRDTTAPT